MMKILDTLDAVMTYCTRLKDDVARLNEELASLRHAQDELIREITRGYKLEFRNACRNHRDAIFEDACIRALEAIGRTCSVQDLVDYMNRHMPDALPPVIGEVSYVKKHIERMQLEDTCKIVTTKQGRRINYTLASQDGIRRQRRA